MINVIWWYLDFYGLLMNNPDAPSEEAFRAHYARPNSDPMIGWVDRVNGVTYLYDLSINQTQIIPAQEPYAGRVDRLNKKLWEIVPPDLLDTRDNWKAAWMKAARKLDVATMQFIIEQGFDVNLPDEDGFTVLNHAVVPNGGSYEVVVLLVEAGADLTIPSNSVDALIQEGWASVSGSGEAREMSSIEAYLRSFVHNR